MYIVGKNMPGYLPESEPYAIEDLTSAFRALSDEIMYDWESHEDGCEEGDDCPVCGEYADAHGDASIPLEGGTTLHADSCAYWVTVAEPLSDGAARRIASDWHGGQASALYMLASTGATTDPRYSVDDLLAEVECAASDATEGTAELDMLAEYVRTVGPRGPVADWANLWA